MSSKASGGPSLSVLRGTAFAAGVAAALLCLAVGWVLQNAFGVIYATGTPSFVIQYTVSLVFFCVVLGEFLSRAVAKGDRTALAFVGFGGTLFGGLILVSWNGVGWVPTVAGVLAVLMMVLAVYSGILELRGRKAEIYQIYRLAVVLGLAAEAGFGYVLPVFGVLNQDVATGTAVVFGFLGIGVSVTFGPARKYLRLSKLAELERKRDALIAELKTFSDAMTEAQQKGESGRHYTSAATPVKDLLRDVEEEIAEIRSREGRGPV